MRHLLETMLKTKRYKEAHEVRHKIALLEEVEEKKWIAVHKEKLAKKRVLFKEKQKVDLEALRIKLENQLQEKIKVR